MKEDGGIGFLRAGTRGNADGYGNDSMYDMIPGSIDLAYCIRVRALGLDA